jgi:hypothetical protein
MKLSGEPLKIWIKGSHKTSGLRSAAAGNSTRIEWSQWMENHPSINFGIAGRRDWARRPTQPKPSNV